MSRQLFVLLWVIVYMYFMSAWRLANKLWWWWKEYSEYETSTCARKQNLANWKYAFFNFSQYVQFKKTLDPGLTPCNGRHTKQRCQPATGRRQFVICRLLPVVLRGNSRKYSSSQTTAVSSTSQVVYERRMKVATASARSCTSDVKYS